MPPHFFVVCTQRTATEPALNFFIRRCAWHPGGKTAAGLPSYLGRRLNSFLENALCRWPRLFGFIRFTDGTCFDCTRRMEEEIDALIKNAGRH
jgi:hypothetical protein